MAENIMDKQERLIDFDENLKFENFRPLIKLEPNKKSLEEEKKKFRAEKELSVLKQWWIGMFRVMSHLTYKYADNIYTLFNSKNPSSAIRTSSKNSFRTSILSSSITAPAITNGPMTGPPTVNKHNFIHFRLRPDHRLDFFYPLSFHIFNLYPLYSF